MKRKVDEGRRALASFSRGTYASHRSLAALFKNIKDTGLPESTSLSSQLRARKDQVNIQTPYGPLILSMTFPCEESELRIPMANPLAYLWQICQGAGGFVEFMRRKIRDAAEDEPWGVILYTDDVGFRDQGGLDPRKTCAIYWSFKQFGHRALCHEAAWFHLAAIRTDLIKKSPEGSRMSSGKYCPCFLVAIAGGILLLEGSCCH